MFPELYRSHDLDEFVDWKGFDWHVINRVKYLAKKSAYDMSMCM